MGGVTVGDPMRWSNCWVAESLARNEIELAICLSPDFSRQIACGSRALRALYFGVGSMRDMTIVLSFCVIKSEIASLPVLRQKRSYL